MIRVGAVCYSFQYGLGLFSYQKREGERLDVFGLLDATRGAGGECAQVFHTLIDPLSDGDLKRLAAKGRDLDLLIEVHGGTALRPDYEKTLHQAAAAGVKVVGCSFGMMMRPDRIGTLKEWDAHMDKCRRRLKEIADVARSLGITIGVENHLDFTAEELRDLVKGADASNVGVVLDVGNFIGTLDDPLEAADLLGPYTVATHYKDFAVEESARGFVLTMVPLGCGSLQLPEITRRLVKHVPPDIGFAIEMMNGQQLKINWLEDRFWAPFRGKTARQVAATLRHVRGKAIDPSEYLPVDEVDRLPHEAHMKLEMDRITRCISYLKGLLR